MAKIDIVLSSYSNFKGYTGNPPANENEYNTVKVGMFEGTAPSWSEIQNKVNYIVDAKASALAKLTALGLTEEEVKSILK